MVDNGLEDTHQDVGSQGTLVSLVEQDNLEDYSN
jgi:hypothetical protein